jgi:hypothetical protein
MRSSLLLLAFIVGSSTITLADYTPLPAPYSDYCILDGNINLYDPKNANKVKWYTVNLDAPPEEHFKEIATAYSKNINDLIGVVKDLIVPWFPEAIKIVDILFEVRFNTSLHKQCKSRTC